METKQHIIAHINKLLEETSEENLRTIWFFVRAMLKPANR